MRRLPASLAAPFAVLDGPLAAAVAARLPVLALVLGGVALAGASGCQTHMGGQTLPSAYYLRDDVQYFPAGPEFQLTNQVRQIEEYRARQGGLDVQ